MYNSMYTFEWDDNKNISNVQKHGLSFEEAQNAFFDTKRVIVGDVKHSMGEYRFFCIGDTGQGIATVRFTVRNGSIRMFGAGYWREGKQRYERENDIH